MQSFSADEIRFSDLIDGVLANDILNEMFVYYIINFSVYIKFNPIGYILFIKSNVIIISM